MFQNKRREESRASKIEFEVAMLPKKVSIGYTIYYVTKYEFPPKRCYKCQHLGHKIMASNCTAPERCLLCAGPHNKEK